LGRLKTKENGPLTGAIFLSRSPVFLVLAVHHERIMGNGLWLEPAAPVRRGRVADVDDGRPARAGGGSGMPIAS
jgi:hypothetical protein